MVRPSLFFLLLSVPAWASTALQMDVPALTKGASDVVRAQVTATRCAWTEDHQRLVTFVDVEVREGWKGQRSGKLTVLQPGGELQGIGQRVAGVAVLVAGEEVVLFLERQGQVHRVVGLSQGVYRVERTADGSAARALPASAEGLELVAPPGGAVRPRAALSLEALRAEVQREVQRE